MTLDLCWSAIIPTIPPIDYPKPHLTAVIIPPTAVCLLNPRFCIAHFQGSGAFKADFSNFGTVNTNVLSPKMKFDCWCQCVSIRKVLGWHLVEFTCLSPTISQSNWSLGSKSCSKGGQNYRFETLGMTEFSVELVSLSRHCPSMRSSRILRLLNFSFHQCGKWQPTHWSP